MAANGNDGGDAVHAAEADANEIAPDASRPARFAIVGIGASAGGLAAFEAFFSAMPRGQETGMAFVLVQHLAPDHESMLTELVKRYTSMQVFEVTDGMAVTPNCAYIIPPNRDMAFANGALQLFEPAAPRGHRLPIDFFFRSLAQDQRERAICIVLSGTGSDGTLGLRAIKGEGGMAMAQNPESTEHDGMPQSAIGTGLVDYVLPPAEMPAQLMAFAAFVGMNGRRASSPPSSNTESELEKVFVLLREQTGHDFSQYKQTTISRRIERRMNVQRIEPLSEYVSYLQKAPSEVGALFRDLLIGVTNFFRDATSFEVLETQVLPRLLADRPPDALVRIWVPGCSTGEEAYSIAILLREKLDALKLGLRAQIFATDIDSQAIETARAGIYPGGVAADMTPERFERFFSQLDDNNYRIHKTIRDLLIFSEQDVTKDPPFSKLDLISCRNLMIYMGPELQKKLIPLFHYALNPGGALFLGSSETIGAFGQLFATSDGKAKLYQRNDDARGALRPFLSIVREPETEVAAPSLARKSADQEKNRNRELTEQTLRSSNEMLQSTNEDLQSTNEELETSKEELQSVNEELATVNAELQNKVVDLSRANNDMNNLFAGTGIGTVFVDHQLRVRRFTPAATQFINLIQTDVGRPLGHIVSNLAGYDRLVADVQAVLDTLTPGDVEVQTHAGVSHLLRIRPYRTTENVVEGAVITFTEVTTIRVAQAALRESDTLRGLAGSERDALDAILLQDLEGRILAWNPGAVRMYGWSESEALSMNVRALIPEREREVALDRIQRLGQAETLQPYRTQRLTRDGRAVEVTLTPAAVRNAIGAVYAVSTIERGIAN